MMSGTGTGPLTGETTDQTFIHRPNLHKLTGLRVSENPEVLSFTVNLTCSHTHTVQTGWCDHQRKRNKRKDPKCLPGVGSQVLNEGCHILTIEVVGEEEESQSRVP